MLIASQHRTCRGAASLRETQELGSWSGTSMTPKAHAKPVDGYKLLLALPAPSSSRWTSTSLCSVKIAASSSTTLPWQLTS